MISLLRKLRIRYPSIDGAWAHRLRTLAGLAASWAVLSFCLGANPAELQPSTALPSVDASALLLVYALVALLRKRVPTLVHAVVAIVVLLAFALRIADGIVGEFFHRQFNATVELHLVREGVRLLYQTMPLSDFVLFGILSVVGLVVAVSLVSWASRQAFRSQQRTLGRRGLLLALAATVYWGMPDDKAPERWTARDALAALNPSVVPRIATEVDFALQAAGYRSQIVQRIETAKREIAETPHDLSRLRGATVYLFLIESFGACSYDDQKLYATHLPVLNESLDRLRDAGYGVVSNLMESPTYGAGSHRAQLTLGTGIRIDNDFDYRLVMASDAPTLPRLLRKAGYRSVFAMPGTRLDWPEGEFWGFDKLYDRWQFDYRGPVVGWGELPDQYTIDALHRAELRPGHPPLFAEFALITSHGPWATVPHLFADWDAIGRGESYARVRNREFSGLTWSNMGRAPEAYAATINYDLRVLTDYLIKYVASDALVIALGDHQPVTKVSGHGSSHAVPIFAFSRRPELLVPFRERGYADGLTPRQPAPHLPMESFLPAFLRGFSRGRAEERVP